MRNNIIHDNALEIIKNQYNNEIELLPIVIKCTLHDGIMSSLEKSGMFSYMVFHGGTCLQRVYRSKRLSEDLDFCMKEDISKLDKFIIFCKDFEKTIRDNLPKLYDIDTVDIFFQNPKEDMGIVQEGDVFTWKIGIVVLFGTKKQIINVDLENRKPLTSVIENFGRLAGNKISGEDMYIHVEKPEEILANKFISLFQRKRIQYRDFYDICFLYKINNNTTNKEYLFEKIARRFSPSTFLEKLAAKIAEFKNTDTFSIHLKNELKRFLPQNVLATALSDTMIEYTMNHILRDADSCYTYFTKNT